MTNCTLAEAVIAKPVSMDEGFASEGIRFDSDVCTAEDERMEAVKNKILKKLWVRLGKSPAAATKR